jgi:hypothetical protein
VNRARLRELGFELGARAEAGVSDDGAWFAMAPDGAPVVLKWIPEETVAERYAVLLRHSTSSDHAASSARVPARPRGRRRYVVGAAGPAGRVGAQPVTGDGGASGPERVLDRYEA